MTRLFTPTNALAMLLLFTATIVDCFTHVPTGTTPRNTKTSLYAARSKSKASPLLSEGLEAYPFSFTSARAMTSEKEAAASFNELARLYGDEGALAIVKIEPRALVFNSDNYAPCLEAWTEQFGLEASQGMVARNPGLLGIKPEQAAKPAEDSMAFSYIIGLTRPVPKLAAVGLLLSIATAGFR